MTKYLPHVTFSVSALMALLLSVLQTTQSIAPPYITWGFSVGLPAVIGIITTIQQMVNGGSPLTGLADLVGEIKNLKTAFQQSGLKV